MANSIHDASLVVITLEDVIIRRDAAGRYCLNDLHRAAGSLDKDKPIHFLKLKSTEELISAISEIPTSDRINDLDPVQTVRSFTEEQGTFAVKELVYAYAMWISPAFHLKVIRTFDRVQQGTMMVPNFADPVAAARAWADAYEAKQIAQQQIKLLEEQREADRPYTDLAKAITGESTMIIRDWISMMKDEYGGHIKEKKVREFLHDSGYWYWTQTSPRETRAYAQFDHLFKLETELCSGMPRLLLKITGRGVLELTPIVVRHFER